MGCEWYKTPPVSFLTLGNRRGSYKPCEYVRHVYIRHAHYELGSLLRMLKLLYYRESTAHARAFLQHASRLMSFVIMDLGREWKSSWVARDWTSKNRGLLISHLILNSVPRGLQFTLFTSDCWPSSLLCYTVDWNIHGVVEALYEAL